MNRVYEDYAVYLQEQWAVTDSFSLTFGARYDVLERFDNELSLRLGAVRTLPKGFYCKGLIGTGFRPPTYREFGKMTGDDADDGAFDPSIQSERMKTFELAVGQKTPNQHQWLATVFFNQYSDYIDEEDDPILHEEVFDNRGDRDIKGLELSADLWMIPQTLHLSPGLTYMDHYDKYKSQKIHGMSAWLLYCKADWKVNDIFNFGLTANYVSRPHVDVSFYQGDTDYVDPTINKSYTTLGVHATLKINKHLELYGVGRNITNKQYFSPHANNGFDYEWPGSLFLFYLKGRY